MIGFLLFLVVLAGICLALRHSESQKRTANLQDRAHRAATDIDAEFHRAKRAINEASGQSWRNLVD